MRVMAITAKRRATLHAAQPPPYPEQVIFIRLTGTNWLNDFSTLVSSGTVVGGPQTKVYGVASRNQLTFLRERGVVFEEVGTGRKA